MTLAAVILLPFWHVATAAAASPPHVLIVLMENNSYEQIVGNSSLPYVNGLVAANGSVSTKDLSHPSEPNYLGLTSGSIYDNPQDLTPQDKTYPGPQFTDELASAGIAWKAYMEDMPTACDLTDKYSPGNYDVNHNPFMYFDSVRNNASQCNRVVPYTQLATDLNAGTAPPFLWVSPNNLNNMHNGSYTQGDNFVKGLFTSVQASSWWTPGSRIILTWDEGVQTEQVLTVVVGSAHGTQATGGNEYGTLRGLEETYGVGLLGHSADSNVGDILPLLNGAASPAPSAAPSPPPAASPSPTPSSSPGQPPPPPSGPGQGTRGIFRFSSTDFAAMHAAGFNAATDGGVQSHGDAESAAGITGMVWVPAYDNSSCAQTLSNTEIAGMVQANVSAGHPGLRYEIGDEPTTNGCNAAPVYTSITQAVHAADPSAKTWVADDQFQVGSPVQQGVPMKGTVDVLAFDVYPCKSGPCDYSAIDSAVQQIHAASVSNWEFIIQDFNSSPWRWPTPSEIQTQFDHWKNQGASGYWVFAWDYQNQQVSQQTGNVAALQQINSAGIGTAAPSQAPAPTSNSSSATPRTGSAPAAAATPTPTPTPTPSPTPTEPTASAETSPTTATSDLPAVVTAAGSSHSGSGPTALGMIVVGSGLVSALGGVLFLSWRRRRVRLAPGILPRKEPPN